MQKTNFYTPTDSSKIFLNIILYSFVLQVALMLVYSIIASTMGLKIQELTQLESIKYINAFIIEIFFVLIYFVYMRVHSISVIKANNLNKPLSWQNIAIILVLMGFIYVLSSPICAVFESFLEFMGYNLQSLNIKLDNPLAIILCVLFLGILPGVIEELIFRGAVLHGLKKYGKWFSIIVSALLFMLMHGNIQQTIYQFGCGIIFGLLVWETGSLWASIIIHCANNTLMIILQSLIDCGVIASEAMPITWIYVVLAFILVVALAFVVMLAIKLINKYKLEAQTVESDIESEEITFTKGYKEFKNDKKAFNYLLVGILISCVIILFNTIM